MNPKPPLARTDSRPHMRLIPFLFISLALTTCLTCSRPSSPKPRTTAPLPTPRTSGSAAGPPPSPPPSRPPDSHLSQLVVLAAEISSAPAILPSPRPPRLQRPEKIPPPRRPRRPHRPLPRPLRVQRRHRQTPHHPRHLHPRRRPRHSSPSPNSNSTSRRPVQAPRLPHLAHHDPPSDLSPTSQSPPSPPG